MDNNIEILWKDLKILEEDILNDIEATENPFYYGMLDVLRWIKEKNINKVYTNEQKNLG